MLCIMYTATIFGAEETTLSEVTGVTKKIPKVIWEIIDEFQGINGVYKEVGHLEPYSDQYLFGSFLKLIAYTSITTLSTAVLVRNLFKTLPKPKAFLVSIPVVTLALATVIKIDRILHNQLASRLKTITPTRVEVWDDLNAIGIQPIADGHNVYRVERRSLSDLQLSTVPLPPTLFESLQPDVVKRDEIICVLKNGKVNIFLVDDYDDHSNSEDRMYSLPTPENVTAFAVSKDKNIIVTIGENNGMRKWELQKNKDMDTIMNTD